MGQQDTQLMRRKAIIWTALLAMYTATASAEDVFVVALLSPIEGSRSFHEQVYLLNRTGHTVEFKGYKLSRKPKPTDLEELARQDLGAMVSYKGSNAPFIVTAGTALLLDNREIARRDMAFDTLEIASLGRMFTIHTFEVRR